MLILDEWMDVRQVDTWKVDRRLDSGDPVPDSPDPQFRSVL